jgi:Sulfatase
MSSPRQVIAGPHSLTVTALIVGATTGLADATLIETNLGHFCGLPYAQASTWSSVWLFVPLVWIVFSLFLGAVVSLRSLRRFRVIALILGGPGLLLLSRGGRMLRHQLTMLPVAHIIVLCIVLSFAVAFVVAVAIDRMVRTNDEVVGKKCIVIAMLGVFVLLAGAHQRPSIPVGHGMGKTPSRQNANVVLIFLDTLRLDDARQMKKLAAFGSAAVSFENAWAPAPWTLPSHSAVLSGVDPWTIRYDKEDRSVYRARPRMLAERFKTQGYTTAAIFANPGLTPGTKLDIGFESFQFSNGSPGCRSGLGYLLGRVYAYSGYQGSICASMSGADVSERAMRFIHRAPRPYFLALNYFDAHDPYFVKSECRDRFFKGFSEADRLQLFALAHTSVKGVYERNFLERIHGQYRAATHCLDRSLGELFGALASEADSENTIVAIVGDHGEQFGEHGLLGHGNSVYAPVLRVPLIIKIPGKTPGRVTDPVSITGLYYTLSRFALGNGSAVVLLPSHEPVIASEGALFSAVGARYHLIHGLSGDEEVYDYAADPGETAPLAPHAFDSEVGMLHEAVYREMRRWKSQESNYKGIGYLQ